MIRFSEIKPADVYRKGSVMDKVAGLMKHVVNEKEVLLMNDFDPDIQKIRTPLQKITSALGMVVITRYDSDSKILRIYLVE